MSKIGFVYAGQGSQVVGMGKSFYDNYQIAKDVFDNIDLDIDVKNYVLKVQSKNYQKLVIRNHVWLLLR